MRMTTPHIAKLKHDAGDVGQNGLIKKLELLQLHHEGFGFSMIQVTGSQFFIFEENVVD